MLLWIVGAIIYFFVLYRVIKFIQDRTPPAEIICEKSFKVISLESYTEPDGTTGILFYVREDKKENPEYWYIDIKCKNYKILYDISYTYYGKKRRFEKRSGYLTLKISNKYFIEAGDKGEVKYFYSNVARIWDYSDSKGNRIFEIREF